MHILMLAAENDALPGGKVGGLGDVIRDLPNALAQAGDQVTVLLPGYGVFSQLPDSYYLSNLSVPFAGALENVSVHVVPRSNVEPGVTILVIEHPLLAIGGAGTIYIHDGEGPFATDAHRFALASAAAAEAITQGVVQSVDVVHCHDWHTGCFLFLRRFSARYAALRDVRTVFTIHNLSLQGIRPFKDNWSSLEAWFPDVIYNGEALADLRYHGCINLMRTAINLADRVSTVSPTYAHEITQASDWSQGRAGGDGLEGDAQRLAAENRLLGILNGCNYMDPEERLPAPGLWELIERQLDGWADSGKLIANHYYALKQILRLQRRRSQPGPIVLSVTRLTFQKVGFLTMDYGGVTVMDRLLELLGKGQFIMLGSGDHYYEQFFTQCMRRHDNFVFLQGFAQGLSGSLYASCDLFLMPSVFEPCGISQMLAMRAGLPCLVHQTGGLNDTVRDGDNGFSFGGYSLAEKLEALLVSWSHALALYRGDTEAWRVIAQRAGASRYEWHESVRRYQQELYQG